MLKGKYGFYYGGDTFLRGKFSNLNEIKDYLDHVSTDLKKSDMIINLSENYDDLFSSLKKPLLKKIFRNSDKFLNSFFENSFDDVETFLISEEDYDLLYKNTSQNLYDKVYNDIKSHYDKINDKLKKEYSMILNDDEIYYSFDIKFNDYSDISFKERLGFPVLLNSIDYDEFYLIEKGDKIVHDDNGSILFKDKTTSGLEDLIKFGSKISKINSKKDNHLSKEYVEGIDYISI